MGFLGGNRRSGGLLAARAETLSEAARSYSADSGDSWTNFGDINKFDPGGPEELGSIVRACVNRITSRATSAGYQSRNGQVEAKIRKPNRWISAYYWYRQLYEQMLLTGNAFAVLDEGKNWQVAISSGSEWSQEEGIWRLRLNNRDEALVEVEPGRGRMAHFHLGFTVGNEPQKAPSPVEEIAEALGLHEEMRSLVLDYAVNGHKLGGTFQTRAEVTDDEGVDAVIGDMKDQIERGGGRRYGTLAVPAYLEYREVGRVAPPDPYGMDLAIREVARTYGVPVELLAMGVERSDHSNVDSHLLTDAVIPLVESVAAGWEAALHTDVTYEPLSLFKSTLGSSAKLLMALAQTGVPTVQECRRILGLPELMSAERKAILEGTDYIMPQTAGAPDRGGKKEGGGRNEGGDGSKTAKQTGNGQQ